MLKEKGPVESFVFVLLLLACAGKSTQTPQFLLDLMLESAQGSATNILVTQPRRISAIGLAERVADERAEKCGQSVGYRIRGENKVSAATRLTFVTTGVLLRQLTSRTALAKISHIVIDEVHERSVEIDFLLLILKQLLPSYPWLKLVLMSATVSRTFCTRIGAGGQCQGRENAQVLIEAVSYACDLCFALCFETGKYHIWFFFWFLCFLLFPPLSA